MRLMQTRVLVYDQIRQHDRPNEWCLMFQQVRYVYESGEKEDGFRFIWTRPDGSLQAARGQARIPSLSTALWFIQQAKERNWGTADGDADSGLQMMGLSEEMQGVCETVYKRFLERHGLQRWPLKISVNETEPLPNMPRRYLMDVACGVEGRDSSSTKSLTEHPDQDLRLRLERELEIHYEYKKSLEDRAT